MALAPGPSVSSTSPIRKYDVYLSFRGEDVRHGFVSHLYSALGRKGIATFTDDVVGRGTIADPMFQAIELSQFAIVVISENYASSTWCLDELVKILESKCQAGTVFPVFYHVDPSHVQHQRGSIGEAFEHHETRFPADRIGRWREALHSIASLSGWQQTGDRDEAKLVEDIVESVRKQLYYKLSNYDHLVGDIESKVHEIISLAKIGSDEICFVGLWGTGGLGKTTLAQCVYDAIHDRFEASCFLSNISEDCERHGLAYLQRKLLFDIGHMQDINDSFIGRLAIRRLSCDKKVLIILDDVSHERQLENLAGSEQWFGVGSKIIITTRDKSLLTVYKQFEIYEVGTLDPDESRKLFCQKAFKKNEPTQGHSDLLKEIIGYANGVPLVLKVLGSILYNKSQSEWRDTLDKYRESLPKEIFSTLRISYDELEEECKMIFLDIACFFTWRTKFEVTNILETCGVHPISGINVLIEKALLSCTQTNPDSSHNSTEGQDMHGSQPNVRSDIFLPKIMYHRLLHEASEEYLNVYNVLQVMARKIVYQESPDAGSRSRLWNMKDIDRLLKTNKETKHVECIVVNLYHPFKANWNPACFLKMRKLRLLDVSRVVLSYHLTGLPRTLKFLRWDFYALKNLPPINSLYDLGYLQLRNSKITKLWDGTPELRKLRTIDLSNSDDLRGTPDFSGTPNLEKLFFNYCVKLVFVHESVGKLKKLVELSLRNCTNLKTLPTCLDMPSLEVFILGDCPKLEKLPEFSGNMRRLCFLDMRNTSVTEIPLYMSHLGNLKYLDLSGCSKLKSIPQLPSTSVIHADKNPFLASTVDLQLRIESRVSEHGVAEDPIHIVIDSKGKEEVPPWFEQPELRHSKDKSGEVVTITADIPSDMANSEGELWGIAVCIIFECLPELAWRAFTIDWMFQDYNHTNDKKGGSPHQAHVDADNPIDSTTMAVYSKKTVDDDPLPKIFSFVQSPQAEIKCRVYKGFFPIDKEKCRHHPSGRSGQVHLTLSFLTTNTIGKEIAYPKETSFGDLEIKDWGWRLVCIKKEMDASGSRIRHEAEIADNVLNPFMSEAETAIHGLELVLNDLGDEMPCNSEISVGEIQSKVHTESSSSERIRQEGELADNVINPSTPEVGTALHRSELVLNESTDEMPCNSEISVGEIQSKEHLGSSSARIRHEAEIVDNVMNPCMPEAETAIHRLELVLNESGVEMPCNSKNLVGEIQSKVDMDSSSGRIRHEAEIAGDTANFTLNELCDEMPSNIEHLVGDIQSKVDRIISLLKMELNDTCFIGIWGDSGIGKTTLARLVYDEILSNFDATCFLDNVREDSERVGIVSLQKKLLSQLGFGKRDINDFSKGAEILRKFLCHKKVLIILDDVSETNQLESLAGNKEWFGAGSKIVITTTDKKLLTLNEQFQEYEVESLHPDESLKLLCQEAFQKDKLDEGYLHLSKEVIEHSCGLPLVVKVLGSFLCKKDQNQWRNALERLRQNSPTDISNQLRICYDGLEDEEYKRIFLDTACLFNRELKFRVTNILELCGPYSIREIKVLLENSMLNVNRSNLVKLHNIQNMRRDIFLPTYLYDRLLQEASKECLYMHDLLQEMGRNIVIEESPISAGGRSRLWSLEDIDLVLKENKGTEHVQSIVLRTQEGIKADWDPNCFSKTTNLKLLGLSKVHLSKKPEFLPAALKFLRWDDYSEDFLPSIETLCNLESLQMCNSKIRTLWEGNPVLNKLRIIDMSGSESLSESPNLSGTPNLEELLLNRCRKLVRVHESVGKLKKLVKLSLQECKRLEVLPKELETDNLAEFILSGCLKLEKLPEFGRNMGCLYFLDVRGTDITEIPQSIIHLTSLKYLDLALCGRLTSIPELPPKLIISASNCSFLEPTSALRHLYASCAPKDPIHLFYDFQLLTRIPTWFERCEYYWGKDTDGPTSREFVTITADIPSNIVADNNEEHWGIAVCVAFQFLSQAWLGFSINWNFIDKCHPKKTKINGTPACYMHDCRVYVGFYPFGAKECRQHSSGEGSHLDLTLEFPATNIIKGLHDLEIMGCGWRLACKKDFDKWSESGEPSPPTLGFLNRDSGDSSNNSITKRKGKRKYQ